jgi:hypothetical protein
MMSSRKVLRLWALIIVALISTACGEDSSKTGSEGPGPDDTESFGGPFTDVEAYPVFISSEVVVGDNRFLLGLLDDNDAPIGTPDIDVAVAFFDLEVSNQKPVTTTDTDFIWSVPRRRGVYVTSASFSHPGEWGAEVRISGDGISENVRTSFEVLEEGSTPAIGAPAPASENPTADDVEDLTEISTDTNPNANFYRYSVAEALELGEPFVVTFATPKFCTSAVCGPTLDVVKKVSRGVAGVNFIHVEVYENLDDPNNLELVESVDDWGLPTEPWVFVVDNQGDVAAKFEGVVGAGELRSVLESL